MLGTAALGVNPPRAIEPSTGGQHCRRGATMDAHHMTPPSWRPLLAAALLPLVSGAPAWPDDSADHEALRQLRIVYERAVNEDSVELLRPHLDPDFSGVTMTNEIVADFEHLRVYWGKIRDLTGKGGRYHVEFAPEQSAVYGDLAVVKGRTHDQVRTGDGREYDFSTNWTALCRRRDGQWRILRVHASMDPVGNPFVLRGARDLAVKVGAGALAVGALAGWLAHRALARRRRNGALKATTSSAAT